MKKKKIYQEKQKQKQLRLAVIVFVAMLLALVVGWAICNKPKNDPSALESLIGNTQEKYDELMTRIAPTNVCPNLVPVIIWREENGKKLLHCTGGLFTADPGHSVIITCGHAFWNIAEPGRDNGPMRYYYQVLQPFEKAFHPIASVEKIQNTMPDGQGASRDAAVCIPGPSAMINKMDDEEAEYIQSVSSTFSKFKENIVVRSIVTGEEAPIIGSSQINGGGPTFFVLVYDSWPGQSGTPFVGNTNTIYILDKMIPLTDQLRSVFGLDSSHKSVSLCSAIGIK